MAVTHFVCKKWDLLESRYRFFITYSFFYCVFFSFLVFAGIYEVYGFDGAKSLMSLVLWNFYVLSLQYAYGKLKEVNVVLLENEIVCVKNEERDLKPFVNKNDKEVLKNEQVKNEQNDSIINKAIDAPSFLRGSLERNDEIQDCVRFKKDKEIENIEIGHINELVIIGNNSSKFHKSEKSKNEDRKIEGNIKMKLEANNFLNNLDGESDLDKTWNNENEIGIQFLQRIPINMNESSLLINTSIKQDTCV